MAPNPVPPSSSRVRRDPVFIFMVVAMVLAVISSLTLRAVIPNAGPNSARAGDLETPDTLGPLPQLHAPHKK